jgi:hypothetical protein
MGHERYKQGLFTFGSQAFKATWISDFWMFALSTSALQSERHLGYIVGKQYLNPLA